MYLKLCQIVSLLVLAAIATPTSAVTIVVTSDSGQADVSGACTLRDAMTAANSDVPVGGCDAGEMGSDTIELPQRATIVLSAPDNVAVEGPNGLPAVRQPLVIHGNGSTLSRATSCDRDGVLDQGEFRFFYVASATLTLESTQLVGGCADADSGDAGYGGALLVVSASFQETILKGVDIESTYSKNAGAVVLFGGTLIVEDSSIVANESGNGASAVFSASPYASEVNIFMTNTTISGNGGGSENSQGDYAVVTLLAVSRYGHFSNVTINANKGTGGVWLQCLRSSCFEVKNSIIADNAGDNCKTPNTGIVAVGTNLSSDNTCPTFSLQNISAELGPLTHGGSTRAHEPIAGSPAIDAVEDCTTVAFKSLTADQHGNPRPWDGNEDGSSKCDLGAVEAGSTQQLFRSGFEL